MKFGLFSQTAAPLGSDHAGLYQDFLAFAIEAERLGFWSLWTTEHHFSPDKTYSPYGASPDEYPVQVSQIGLVGPVVHQRRGYRAKCLKHALASVGGGTWPALVHVAEDVRVPRRLSGGFEH